MLCLKFKCTNPFVKPRESVKSPIDFCKDFGLTTHKNLEIQLTKFEMRDLLNFELDLRWNGSDHQGPVLEIEILGLMFRINIYDSRHWDYENHCWEQYNPS